MNAREWCALAAPAPDWARLAGELETEGGGLEAVFDDAGAAGLCWRPEGDRRRWAAWLRRVPMPGPAPERCWAMLAGGGWGDYGRRLVRWAPGEAPLSGPLRRLSPGRPGLPGGLDRFLMEFHGLHPLSELTLGLDRLSARLAEPAPWPLFAVTDLAKPFAAKAGAWARRLGARGVAGLVLGQGRMEVSLK